MSRPLIAALPGGGISASEFRRVLHPLNSIADVVALHPPIAFDAAFGAAQPIVNTPGLAWPALVNQALPSLRGQLEDLSSQRGVARSEIVLLGFSEGAILGLGAVVRGVHTGSAIAIAGRIEGPVPASRPEPSAILVVHDRSDTVVAPVHARTATAQLKAAGYDADLVMTEGCGHAVCSATLRSIAGWLARTRHSL